MIPPLSLPDWLPWWAMIAILVPLLVYLLAALAMPFNTIGLKGRLDLIDARLDEIQSEIRALAPHLADQGDAGLPRPTYGEAARAVPPTAPVPPPVRPWRPRQPEPVVDSYDDEPDYADPRFSDDEDMPPPARPPDMSRQDGLGFGTPRAGVRPDLSQRPPPRRPDSRPETGRSEPRIDWPR
ncbi:MAG TPA: hypothetical protein VGH36_10900 [Acetobacteraceae bacterium]|jgi:hypothetical protein